MHPSNIQTLFSFIFLLPACSKLIFCETWPRKEFNFIQKILLLIFFLHFCIPVWWHFEEKQNLLLTFTSLFVIMIDANHYQIFLTLLMKILTHKLKTIGRANVKIKHYLTSECAWKTKQNKSAKIFCFATTKSLFKRLLTSHVFEKN